MEFYRMLIGICGLINSGKSTIADHLVKKHGYELYSWANPLKDVTSFLFGWDRTMLEGATPLMREIREQPDAWWSSRLGKSWSPRYALQYMGTDVMRDSLHQDIWVLIGQKAIAGKENVVIADTRFPNEIAAIRQMGGLIWNVQRGKLPSWCADLEDWKKDMGEFTEKDVVDFMQRNHPNIHASEYSWHGNRFDTTIYNNWSIETLRETVDLIISD